MKKIAIVVVSIALLLGCKPKAAMQDFDIEMKHFFGAEGYTVRYIVNQDSLKLFFDCDFEGCEDTLLYQIGIEKEEVQEFYSYLSSLKYDTLKNSYSAEGFDGRYTTVDLSGSSIPSKSISLVRYKHVVIEELIDKVDLLIPEVKYRLYPHKYSNE